MRAAWKPSMTRWSVVAFADIVLPITGCPFSATTSSLAWGSALRLGAERRNTRWIRFRRGLPTWRKQRTAQRAVRPPSTMRTCPTTNRDSGEAR